MTEPYVTLKIPVEEDVPIVREMLQQAYLSVEREYEMQDDPTDHVMRKGSLCMELSAQLNNQTDETFTLGS